MRYIISGNDIVFVKTTKRYRPITVNFDPTDEDDQKILNWLEKNKSKTNSYSAQIRKALIRYMAEETK